MRNELLNELKLEDLQGEARELAETIGMDAFRRLGGGYGGCTAAPAGCTSRRRTSSLFLSVTD